MIGVGTRFSKNLRFNKSSSEFVSVDVLQVWITHPVSYVMEIIVESKRRLF